MGWKRSYSGITPVSVTALNFLAEISWFPRGEGFWVRGGIGGGQFDFTVTLPAEKVFIKKGGWTYSAGAGYEFRVSDQAAIGFAYDVRYLSVKEFDDFDPSSTLSHNVSLNLHFYM